MPFSIDTHFLPFDIAANSGIVRIVESAKGEKHLAATLMLGEAGSAAESRLFGENLKDFFNGDALNHRIGKELRTMHYHLTDDSHFIIFKFQEHAADGQSKGTSDIAFVLQIEEPYRDRLLKRVEDPSFDLIPESGTKIERRSELRSSTTPPVPHRPNPGM